MKQRRLDKSFFIRPTLQVSKDLLGKYLVRRIGKKKLVGRIVETEAYIGPKDRASHAFLPRRNFQIPSQKTLKRIFGSKLSQNKAFLENFLRGGGKITPRNKTEYLEGGHIYIYLCYGMHWQLNFTTSKAGKPECVLIRALEPMGKRKKKIASGPGKLCKWMRLNKSFDGEDLCRSGRIWLAASIESRRASPKGREDREERIKKSQIIATKRIGIDYAGEWTKKLLRFYVKDNPFISSR